MARTVNVCGPSARPAYGLGAAQDPHAPASSLHSKVAAGSLATKEKLAAPVPIVPEGPDVIVVTGAVSSVPSVSTSMRQPSAISPTSSWAKSRTHNLQLPFGSSP